MATAPITNPASSAPELPTEVRPYDLNGPALVTRPGPWWRRHFCVLNGAATPGLAGWLLPSLEGS